MTLFAALWSAEAVASAFVFARLSREGTNSKAEAIASALHMVHPCAFAMRDYRPLRGLGESSIPFHRLKPVAIF